MNRRGQEEVGKVLWELIGLILVVVVVAAVLVLLVRFVGSGGDNEEQASLDGLLTLGSVVEQVSSGVFGSNPSVPVFVAPDYTIVGFNAGEGVSTADGCNKLQQVPKPSYCGTSACLCLFPTANDLAKTKPKSCITFSNVDYFVSFWYSDTEGVRGYDSPTEPAQNLFIDTFKGQCVPVTENYQDLQPKMTPAKNGVCASKYASLSIHGKCGGLALALRPLYVERAFVDGKNYVLVSAPLSADTMSARKDAVERGQLLPLFTAGKAAFVSGKYSEAIEKLKKFVDLASEKSVFASEVEEARFDISESYYLTNEVKTAAPLVVEYLKKYGIVAYFHRVGGADFTVYPSPYLAGTGARFASRAGTQEIAEVASRTLMLGKALPDSGVLAYLAGHLQLEQGMNDYKDAIALLKFSSATLTPHDIVHPLIAVYDLGKSYQRRITAIQDFNQKPSAEDVSTMLASYARVAKEYDYGKALQEVYNDAHTQLALECTRWKGKLDTSAWCTGVPILEAGTTINQVYPDFACTGTMDRCGDLTVEDFQALAVPGLTSTIHVTNPNAIYNNQKVYTCKDGKWTLTQTCGATSYCTNTEVLGGLSAGCFTPSPGGLQ